MELNCLYATQLLTILRRVVVLHTVAHSLFLFLLCPQNPSTTAIHGSHPGLYETSRTSSTRPHRPPTQASHEELRDTCWNTVALDKI